MAEFAVNRDLSKKSNLILLFFLLSPIMSLFLSIKGYKYNWAKNIVWMFCGYFGYTFVIGNNSSDINRYKIYFTEIASMNLNFFEFLSFLYNKGETDFLQQIIFYFISRFSLDFNFTLMIIGLIFGYFFSRNIWFILRLNTKKTNWFSVLVIFIFSFIFACWDINVMRFTLAAHIFLYGIFEQFLFNKKIGYFFILLSPLMHFTFSIVVMVVLIFKILGIHTKVFFIFFVLTTLFSEINPDVLSRQFSFLPQSYIDKSEDYLALEYIEYKKELLEEKNFRGKYYQSSLKWAVAILLSFIFFNLKKIIKNEQIMVLFSFTLLYMAIFNLVGSLPSMNRFLFVGYLSSLTVFYFYFSDKLKTKEKMVSILCTPLLVFYFIVKLRIGLEFTGFSAIFGNPITAVFNTEDFVLIELFK